MATSNVDDEITVGVSQTASQKIITAGLKQILSQIKDLEVKINHAKLDKSAITELQTQLNSLKTSLNISNVDINQGEAAKIGQKIGKQISNAINKEISITNAQKSDSSSKSKTNFFESLGLDSKLFDSFKNIGKCRMSVRISNHLLYCFEYALHT